MRGNPNFFKKGLYFGEGGKPFPRAILLQNIYRGKGVGDALILNQQGLKNVPDYLWIFLKPPHGIRIPMNPKRDINAHAVSPGQDLIPEFGPDPVEHLKFIGISRKIHFPEELECAIYKKIIMRGDGHVAPCRRSIFRSCK